jgi:N-methylhydantoinase A/oxoprolinase/acetone carboxylase beta subunit
MSYRLGIDTGGTYTDAVLVNAQQKVIATFKSLTTRQDLAVGIGKAISGLPSELLAEVQLVALSTTLTTNSVVEGRGAEVCALLVGYNEGQLKKSGLTEIVTKGGAFLISGGHDADGNEKHVLDENAARDAILKLKDSVSAFAISSMFATRNSAHELKLRALVEELSGKPVACGHELASSLGAPQRALTAVLNARMIPYIQQLIESVKGILASLDISAPLMIVKGDGSLVNTLTAQQQPVATVLSGPAASVIGACALSGLENAIVADMGGTTTDIAVVTNGQPKLSAEGAQIGDWQPMVEAVKVYCVGLGGDSEIHMSAASGLKIGPRRVVPLSLLASEHPWIIKRLNQQLNAYPNARHNKFVVRMESDDTLLQQLNEKEQQAWELLLEGPVELDEIAEKDKDIARAMGKLQRMGLAIYTGFTPTDAAHVLGLSNHLNTEAANLAAKIWSSQMRCLYGLGKWKNGDAIGPSEEVHQLVTKRISNTLIEASLSDSDKLSQARASKLTELLTQLILSSDNSAADSLFNLEFNADYPLVAVGGPASSYYPSVAKALGVELHLPEHAEVANAVGAVMGSVVQRAQVTISQPTAGIYHIYNKEAPLRFANIDDAFSKAEQMVGEQATAQAKAAGASDIEMSLTRIENHVKHEIDGDLFLDCVVQATATGRPSYHSS